MMQLGTIPIIVEEKYLEPGGAAFLLTSPPRKDTTFHLEGGEIESRSGQPYAVARFPHALNDVTAFSVGHNLAQQGLDLMSILGMADLAIKDAEDEHLIWWTEEAGPALRVVSTLVLRFSVGPVTLGVTNAEGKAVPASTPYPRHHVAFRFFRLAQTTDDLFDAYRNMYLAFEALLSSRYPKPAKEKEWDWLCRALSGASPDLKLDGLRFKPEGDLVGAILEVIYKDARLPLFHAKEGLTYFPPHNSPGDREAVSRALALITQIVIRMAATWFDAPRAGGGVFFGWVYETLRKSLANPCAYASSYDGPLAFPEKDLSHSRFQTAAPLHSRLAPEYQRGKAPAVLSVASGTELAQVKPLRCIDLVSAGAPKIAHQLEAPLDLDGISRFEALMHIRGENENQPRSLYRR
jgi:hypothetical protein